MMVARPNILILFSDQHRADALGCANPHFPALRSGHRLFQRPSPQKQFPSNINVLSILSGNHTCHPILQ